jgi:hypothetical protein
MLPEKNLSTLFLFPLSSAVFGTPERGPGGEATVRPYNRLGRGDPPGRPYVPSYQRGYLACVSAGKMSSTITSTTPSSSVTA